MLKNPVFGVKSSPAQQAQSAKLTLYALREAGAIYPHIFTNILKPNIPSLSF